MRIPKSRPAAVSRRCRRGRDRGAEIDSQLAFVEAARRTVADASTDQETRTTALGEFLVTPLGLLKGRSPAEFTMWIARPTARAFPHLEAEDLAQELLFELLDSLPRLNDPARLSAFIRAIVRNTALRSPRPTPFEEIHDDMRGPAESNQKVDAPVDPARPRALLSGYHAAFRKLSTLLRKVWALRQIRHQTVAQVASTLDVKEASIPVYMTRARQALSRRLAPVASALKYRVP